MAFRGLDMGHRSHPLNMLQLKYVYSHYASLF
jgi:hypothetical protein